MKYISITMNDNIAYLQRVPENASETPLSDCEKLIIELNDKNIKFKVENEQYEKLMIKIYWNTTCEMTKDILSKTGIDFKKHCKE